MNLENHLPDRVVELLQTTLNAEFATVSAAGVPIDTPMLIFPSEGMRTFDVATGLAYPAKAERARNNPKVGLLFEGKRTDPVVSVAGMAAVRDSDIQANVLRYISETAYARPLSPPWDVARKAVYYWSRMIVAIKPKRILWWDSRAAMDEAPHRWDAPADTVFPPSDPQPAGAVSSKSNWPKRDWRELAESALKLGVPAHLTLCDDEGFPLPIRVRSVALTDAGFILDVPKGAPWAPEGIATLTFLGRETFVGPVSQAAEGLSLTVDRPLPINPFVNDPSELWQPSDDVRQKMMSRLLHELERRGLPIPELPHEEPELAHYATLRRQKLAGNDVVLPS